jgi:hypothetical protein
MAESPVFQIIETIKKPRNLESFYSEAKTLRIYPYGAAEPLVLSNISPLSTIYDLKMGIYKNIGVAPEHQFLARKPSRKMESYFPVDFLWTKFGSKSEMPLVNPTAQAEVQRQASQFVDSAGEQRRELNYSSRLRILLENYLGRMNPQPTELYLFTYQQIKSQYANISERIWYGSIYPYFPMITYGKDVISEAILVTRVNQLDEKEKIYQISLMECWKLT